MSMIKRTGSGDVQAINGDGAISKVDANGYVTLTADDHYFVLGGAGDAQIEAFQIITDATIAGTFTIEGCMLARDKIQGVAPISDYDETAGNWVKLDLPSATIQTFAIIQTTGTGWTVTLSSLAKTAGAGAAIVQLIRLGVIRLRVKAAITTAGTMRLAAAAKS